MTSITGAGVPLPSSPGTEFNYLIRFGSMTLGNVWSFPSLPYDVSLGAMKALAGRLPEGPWHYPADQIADMPLREIAAEITREQLFRQLHAELPYALTVEQESWEDFADGSLRVGQQIIVAREGQRAIVLGEGGQMIKAVREAAQAEIGVLTGRKVHLFLHVKFRENWQDDPERYRAMGLDFDD